MALLALQGAAYPADRDDAQPPEQIAASAAEALHARLAVRDAMAPHLADGWRVIAVDREERTYTLGR